MQKTYSLLLFFPLLFGSLSIHAITHMVSVQSNQFIPATLNVTVGDVIQWNIVDGSFHTTTSLGIPAGAASWDSPVDPGTPTFSYTVNSTGVYNYHCRFHGGMTGSFTAAALPLELRSFTGETVGSSNWLRWETLTEKDVESHIVERSADGRQWGEVGRRPGSGHSTVATKYELEDQRPFSQTYYRLHSVDVDGKTSFSKTILLGKHFNITSVFPNPVIDQATLQFVSMGEEELRLSVTDMNGKLVWYQVVEARQGLNTTVVPLRQLSAGAYDLVLSNARKITASLRVIKE